MSATSWLRDWIDKRRASPGCRLLRGPDGQRLLLSLDESDRYHADVAAGYIFHDPTLKLAMALLKRGHVFFDIGANIGVFSISAAMRGAFVHAFELLDENIAHLQKSIVANRLRNVSVTRGAISDEKGAVGSFGYSAWGHVNQGGTGIPKLTIDSYAAGENISRIDLIKIDIEGSEISALRGMPDVLRSLKPDILVECNAIACGTFGYSYRDILRFIEGFGYHIFRISPQKLHPWEPTTIQESICVDYYATPKQLTNGSAIGDWAVCPITVDEIAAMVAAQDQHSDLHRQYVLTVQRTLPAHRTIEEAVARWQPLQDGNVERVLKVGTGLA
jgi:FkbM family methyltransferase